MDEIVARRRAAVDALIESMLGSLRVRVGVRAAHHLYGYTNCPTRPLSSAIRPSHDLPVSVGGYLTHSPPLSLRSSCGFTPPRPLRGPSKIPLTPQTSPAIYRRPPLSSCKFMDVLVSGPNTGKPPIRQEGVPHASHSTMSHQNTQPAYRRSIVCSK